MAAKKEDLSLTPAERAAQQAHAASHEADQEFAEARVVRLGGPGEVIVLGAGLVGSLCSTMLARKGLKVSVFERYGDIRAIPSQGKSINLSVTSRGLRAIKSLGGTIYQDVLALATPVLGRIIHTDNQAGEEEEVVFQRYGRDDSEFNYSISRYELNCYLIQSAEQSGVKFFFNHALHQSSRFSAEQVVGCTLHFLSGPECNQPVRVEARCPVIGCDGAGSQARYALRNQGLTSFSEDLLSCGYKEVLFPKPDQAAGEFGVGDCAGSNGLHIWPRGDHMLMALPNRDGSFTGTIYMESKGSQDSFEQMNHPARVSEFVQQHYPNALPLVGGRNKMVDQVQNNPEGVLGTVRTDKWALNGSLLLIGDAAHAMVPFFGQGCNCGFEDVGSLSTILDQLCRGSRGFSPTDFTGSKAAQVFAALEQVRKPNADAICTMAVENYDEMKGKTADKRFLALKRVESLLENCFPAKFRSRYAMVCYGGEGNVSYANAQALGPAQDRILEQVLCEAGGEHATTEPELQHMLKRIDLERASALIDKELVPTLVALEMDLTTVSHCIQHHSRL